jgi:hypothetical protein
MMLFIVVRNVEYQVRKKYEKKVMEGTGYLSDKF